MSRVTNSAARITWPFSAVGSPDGEALPEVRSGDALFAVDGDLRIVSWNRAAEELTGIPADGALGRRCWLVLDGCDEHGERVCSPDCPIARAALAGEPVARRVLWVKASEGRRPVSVSTLALGNGARMLALHLLHPEAAPAQPEALRRGDDAPALTARQREILRLLAEGVRAAAIATRLGLSETTVRNHIRATLVRLGCHSQLEAVATARRHGLL